MRTRGGALMRAGALVMMLTLGAAGCDLASEGSSQGRSPVPSITAGGSPSLGGSPSPVGGGMVPQPILDQVMRDAASLAGVHPSEVVVAEARAVTWPNGAAGCPQPDMAYTDALVPGYWVLVTVGERTLDYRGALSSGTLLLCENPGRVPEASAAS